MADTLPSIGMTFGEAADIILRRLKSDLRLKPRTKAKRRERIRAIQKSWDGIYELDIRRIRPAECQKWAKRFQGQVDARTFNETLEMMNAIFNLAEGMGLKMKNPASGIKPLPI
tara:strand:- start:20 stop:361 length:342 start_codon:yes stop_codon:yes gene_type:complete